MNPQALPRYAAAVAEAASRACGDIDKKFGLGECFSDLLFQPLVRLFQYVGAVVQFTLLLLR